MADLKKNPIIVDDMRDYALITLMKTIRRMEILDENRNNETDITKLRHYIGLFAHKAINSQPSEDAEKLFEKYPEIIEIATETDEKKADAMTKDLLQKYRKALLNSVPEYQKLTESNYETVILNAERVYEEVFKPYIDEHNNARRNRNNPENQIDRKKFVKALINGNIDENIERIMFAAKDRIIQKLNERKTGSTRKSTFKEEINSIVPGLTVNYSQSRNTDAVRQANAKVRSYFSAADAKTYRNKTLIHEDNFQKDPNARPISSGSKEDFLKLLGCLAQAGYNQVHKGIPTKPQSFDDFFNVMSKNYPQNTEEVIKQSLGIAKNADKETQLKALAEKSVSVYTQMLGGFIQLRTDLNLPITSNTIKALESYIKGLSSGNQNIQALDLLMEDNGKSSIKSQQSKEQHVNVDHKISVASAITLHIMLHPEQGGALDPNKLQLPQLLDLAEQAAPLVDNISNHRQVIGKSTNDMLEAKGKYVLGAQKDDSILACRYSLDKVLDSIAKMQDLSSETKKRYSDSLKKYSKADKRKVISTSLKLPEPQSIANARRENTTERNILDVRVITENVLKLEK